MEVVIKRKGESGNIESFMFSVVNGLDKGGSIVDLRIFG